MPRDDGQIARSDPESVPATPPSRLVTVALLAVTTGGFVRTVTLAALGGMVLLAGWAAGRLVVRR